YLAIRLAVEIFPAFLMAAIRQTLAGIIIIIIGFLWHNKIDFSRENLLHQALIGFLLITVGNGLVCWGEKYVPSGVAALICSLMPMSAVAINLLIYKKEKLNYWII